MTCTCRRLDLDDVIKPLSTTYYLLLTTYYLLLTTYRVRRVSTWTMSTARSSSCGGRRPPNPNPDTNPNPSPNPNPNPNPNANPQPDGRRPRRIGI